MEEAVDKFSVAMCLYNGDDLSSFIEAYNSIMMQTVLPSEIIIVVDGPIDAEKMEYLDFLLERDSICAVHYLVENYGHGVARQISLEKASHEYVALMDSDDISINNRFELQLRYFHEYPDVSLVGGHIAEFLDTPENIVSTRLVPLLDKDIKQYMQKRCPINQVTVMLKKSNALEVGGYVDWYYEEDYYLWIRMALAGYKFMNIDKVLVNVRVSKDMYKRRGGIRYFRSELRIQNYMLRKNMISIHRYLFNLIPRIIVQVFMTNNLRGYVFKHILRRVND